MNNRQEKNEERLLKRSRRKYQNQTTTRITFDVWHHIQLNKRIGESNNDVLRRLLGIEDEENNENK